jgi:type VI secretion system protein ImpA
MIVWNYKETLHPVRISAGICGFPGHGHVEVAASQFSAKTVRVIRLARAQERSVQMPIDVEALIAPLSDDAPAGPDLSYDPARQTIEAAFEKSVSDDGADAAEIDWEAMIGLILEQAATTRDIWLAVYLMRAGAKQGQLETVESGANLLAGLLESLWDTVHPKLEEYGFQGRKAPCEGLTRIGEFLAPMRKVILIEHPRLGRYSAADFERFRDNGDSEEGFGMFRALLLETDDEKLQEVVERISAISDAVRRTDAVLIANAGDETGTNFQATIDALGLISKNVASFMKVPSANEGDTASGESGNTGDNQSPAASFGGAINSREDVLRALDAITIYYQNKEPGSPVPFALRRARDWVSLDFMSVLEDIAPGSLEEARRVLMNGRSSGGSDDWASSSDES